MDIHCVKGKNKRNYIFVDVEGDNDPVRKTTGSWIYTNFIIAATCLSHAHIYNYNGLPGKNFVDYFKSIDKIMNEHGFHPNFHTSLYFTKRNHDIEDEEYIEEDTEEYEDAIKEYYEEFSHFETKKNFTLISTPPNSIKFNSDPIF